MRSDELYEATAIFGMEPISQQLGYTTKSFYGNYTTDNHDIRISVRQYDDGIITNTYCDGSLVCQNMAASIDKFIKHMDTTFSKYGIPYIECCVCDPKYRQRVCAAINTRNMAENLVRVKSSNLWSYGMNVKSNRDRTGDVVVQFKSKSGGAGDVYIYYDVPTTVYRRWQSAPSKGHYFWVYLRNNYKYSKLTGDKRGKLPNAVN